MKKSALILALSTILFSCGLFKAPKPAKVFYCKINGVDFVPEIDKSPIGGVGSSPLKVSRDFDNGWFTVLAVNNSKLVALFIKLAPNSDIVVGNYDFINEPNKSKGIYSFETISQQKENLNSTSGKINITKIEGTTFWATFEFKTKSLKSNTDYNITNGQIIGLRY